MTPRTRSETMAEHLRSQADLARRMGKERLAQALEVQAQRFDPRFATIVPGTMQCVHLENP
jgi:hypothetical protein